MTKLQKDLQTLMVEFNSLTDENSSYGILTDKYLPSEGQGENKASQLVTATNKIIYGWYNNGDTISGDLMEYSLMKTQKMKTYMGISFFSLYSDMLFYSYEMTKSLNWQVTRGEVAHFILNSDSFMMLLMSKLESLCKDKIKANDKY